MNNEPSNLRIIPATNALIASFRDCLDNVARERKYLIFLEAPPLEAVHEFVESNFINGNSLQFVAVSGDRVIGWRPRSIKRARKIWSASSWRYLLPTRSRSNCMNAPASSWKASKKNRGSWTGLMKTRFAWRCCLSNFFDRNNSKNNDP